MATWAIGDVHGCYRSLRRLLRRRAIARSDRLWFVGDLVNRGPRSLETLRYVADLGARASFVLGNHDLHFLARAAGVGEERRRDTLDRLLAAKDADALAAWLRARPLVLREGQTALLHAGVRASWNLRELDRRARAVEAALRGADASAYLRAYRPRETAAELAQAVDRKVLEDLRVFTLLRVTTPRGDPRYDFTGPPDELPAGRVAWHEVANRKTAGATIVCGHWGAQGLLLRDGIVALDTGCAWGGALTAVRLDDCRVEQTGNVD